MWAMIITSTSESTRTSVYTEIKTKEGLVDASYKTIVGTRIPDRPFHNNRASR